MRTKFIDLHCDTLDIIARSNGAVSLRSGDCAISFEKMKQATAMAQFFAIYMPPQDWIHNIVPGCTDDEFIDDLYATLCNAIAQHPDDIAWAKNAVDMENNAKISQRNSCICRCRMYTK